MGQNSSSGNGCFIWGIMITGNLLLFSGSIFGDLSDNGIAWILALIAIVIDIFVIKSVVSAASKKREQQQDGQENSGPSNTISDTTQLNKAPEQIDNSKLGQLKNKYLVPAIPTIPMTIDPLQEDMESYQSVEVLKTVNRVINARKDYIKRLITLKQAMDELLSCPGCSSDKERLDFLNANEEALNIKNNEFNTVFDSIKRKRVKLLSKEGALFSQIRAVFAQISNSQKVVGANDVAYSDFINTSATIPGDLFESSQNPIELNFGAYLFYMLPDVVLVFKKSGKYVTALEPMSMIISFDERQKKVYSSSLGGRPLSYSDNVIASDSTLISQGRVRSGWLHEKKTGGPDLRYSYSNNPRYDSRTDIYAFTEMSIQIGQYKAVYSCSNGAIAAKAKPIFRKYCSLAHRMNTIPSLLRLLESTSKKKENANALSSEYLGVNKDIICKEI